MSRRCASNPAAARWPDRQNVRYAHVHAREKSKLRLNNDLPLPEVHGSVQSIMSGGDSCKQFVPFVP